jgi:hypothetical protein
MPNAQVPPSTIARRARQTRVDATVVMVLAALGIVVIAATVFVFLRGP